VITALIAALVIAIVYIRREKAAAAEAASGTGDGEKDAGDANGPDAPSAG